MKGIYVFLADGFEDLEALAVIDVLRRGGLDVRTVSITDELQVTSAHGVTMTADICLDDIPASASDESLTDYMVFPGGMPGASNLASCEKLIAAMKQHHAAGGSLAAICAAPGLVISQLDNLNGAVFTCYEGFQNPVKEKGGRYTADPSNVYQFPGGQLLVTGRSPGHALSFAYDILETIAGEEAADLIREQMYLL